jgi:hypothetical protein
MRTCAKISFIALVGLGLGMTVNDLTPNAQPIDYSHKKHVEELLIGCLDCHWNAEKHSSAVIPNIEVCGVCHLDVESDHPEERKVAAYAVQGMKIPWRQVHVVPDHVYFSHRRHVALGELECTVCHGDVAQMEKPFSRPYVSMNMGWCTECHEGVGVTNDCASCHR